MLLFDFTRHKRDDSMEVDFIKSPELLPSSSADEPRTGKTEEGETPKAVKLCTVSSHKSNFDNFLKVVRLYLFAFFIMAYDHITKYHLTVALRQ